VRKKGVFMWQRYKKQTSLIILHHTFAHLINQTDRFFETYQFGLIIFQSVEAKRGKSRKNVLAVSQNLFFVLVLRREFQNNSLGLAIRVWPDACSGSFPDDKN
jgi:hypothetical protein